MAPWGGCARLLPLLSSGRLRVLAVSAGAALGAQCSAVPLTRGVVAWEVGSGHQGLPHAGVHIPTLPSRVRSFTSSTGAAGGMFSSIVSDSFFSF